MTKQWLREQVPADLDSEGGQRYRRMRIAGGRGVRAAITEPQCGEVEVAVVVEADDLPVEEDRFLTVDESAWSSGLREVMS